MQITKKEKERRLVFAREKAAQAWTTAKTSSKVLDGELAEAFALILVEEMYKPNLGCATTKELLDEISARIEISPKGLNYSVVGSD